MLSSTLYWCNPLSLPESVRTSWCLRSRFQAPLTSEVWSRCAQPVVCASDGHPKRSALLTWGTAIEIWRVRLKEECPGRKNPSMRTGPARLHSPDLQRWWEVEQLLSHAEAQLCSLFSGLTPLRFESTKTC